MRRSAGNGGWAHVKPLWSPRAQAQGRAAESGAEPGRACLPAAPTCSLFSQSKCFLISFHRFPNLTTTITGSLWKECPPGTPMPHLSPAQALRSKSSSVHTFKMLLNIQRLPDFIYICPSFLCAFEEQVRTLLLLCFSAGERTLLLLVWHDFIFCQVFFSCIFSTVYVPRNTQILYIYKERI